MMVVVIRGLQELQLEALKDFKNATEIEFILNLPNYGKYLETP